MMPREVSWSIRLQFIAFTYALAAWSLYSCTSTSLTFLEAMYKATYGVHLIIWGNFLLVHYFIGGWLVVRMLFGRLTLLEYEHIFERLHLTVLSSLSVLITMNRKNSKIGVIAIPFHVLCQVLHWVVRDRMEFVFAPPIGTRMAMKDLLFSRFMLSIVVLGIVDFKLMMYFYRQHQAEQDYLYYLLLFSDNWENISEDRLSLSLGVDFGLLFLDWLQVVLLNCLKFVELFKAGRRVQEHQLLDNNELENDIEDDGAFILEEKFIYEKIVETVLEILKILLNILLITSGTHSFVVFYNIFIKSIETCERCVLLFNYWKNNRKLHEKLLDVTAGHLDGVDITCTICMDDMLPSKDVKVNNKKAKMLPCGHMLHFGCLKSWMQRAQTCPICRFPVFGSSNPRAGQNANSNGIVPTQSEQQQQQQRRSSWHSENEIPHDPAHPVRNSEQSGFSATNNNDGDDPNNQLRPVNNSNQQKNEPAWISFPTQYQANGKLYFKLQEFQSDKEWEAVFTSRPNPIINKQHVQMQSDAQPYLGLQDHRQRQQLQQQESQEHSAEQGKEEKQEKQQQQVQQQGLRFFNSFRNGLDTRHTIDSLPVIPTSRLEQTEELERLKRRISELENTVGDLLKRIKTD